MFTNSNQNIPSDDTDKTTEKVKNLSGEFRKSKQFIEPNMDCCLIMNESIYNNIKIANPRATKHDIILAAEKAKVLDFAWEFPKGLDTLISTGKPLSTLQQQQIQLAREFLRTFS